MGKTYITKDSGNRQEFSTGARRDIQEGKGRYDLMTFHALRRLAGVFERGAAKYGPHNWRKGFPLSRLLDSALRHVCEWAEGYRDEDHLGQALWNIAVLMETEEMIERGLLSKELNDVYSIVPNEQETVLPDVAGVSLRKPTKKLAFCRRAKNKRVSRKLHDTNKGKKRRVSFCGAIPPRSRDESG